MSAAVLKGLIDKNILEIENIEDSRIKDVDNISKKMPNLSDFQSTALKKLIIILKMELVCYFMVLQEAGKPKYISS